MPSKKWIQPGYCPTFRSKVKKLDASLCNATNGHCPIKEFWSHDAYKYSACLNVMRKKKSSRDPSKENEGNGFSVAQIFILIISLISLVILVILVIRCWRKKNKESPAVKESPDEVKDLCPDETTETADKSISLCSDDATDNERAADESIYLGLDETTNNERAADESINLGLDETTNNERAADESINLGLDEPTNNERAADESINLGLDETTNNERFVSTDAADESIRLCSDEATDNQKAADKSINLCVDETTDNETTRGNKRRKKVKKNQSFSEQVVNVINNGLGKPGSRLLLSGDNLPEKVHLALQKKDNSLVQVKSIDEWADISKQEDCFVLITCFRTEGLLTSSLRREETLEKMSSDIKRLGLRAVIIFERGVYSKCSEDLLPFDLFKGLKEELV